MPTRRLPRVDCSIMKLPPPVGGKKPDVTSPRCGSPVTGCSTLTTSAPQSASTAPPDGTNHHCATSTTRTPSSTRGIRCAYHTGTPGDHAATRRPPGRIARRLFPALLDARRRERDRAAGRRPGAAELIASPEDPFDGARREPVDDEVRLLVLDRRAHARMRLHRRNGEGDWHGDHALFDAELVLQADRLVDRR